MYGYTSLIALLLLEHRNIRFNYTNIKDTCFTILEMSLHSKNPLSINEINIAVECGYNFGQGYTPEM